MEDIWRLSLRWIISVLILQPLVSGNNYQDCINNNGVVINNGLYCVRPVDSEQTCTSINGQLVQIGDAASHETIWDAIVGKWNMADEKGFLLGLYKIQGNHLYDDFRWKTGIRLTYTAWTEDTYSVQSPNGYALKKSFILVPNAKSQSWLDISDDDKSKYKALCQWPDTTKSSDKIHQNVKPVSEANVTSMLPHSLYFKCDNLERISYLLKCDGKSDCKDSSDEQQCEFFNCGPDKFRCNNGRCISMQLKCDYKNDCPHGEDELNCKRVGCLSLIEFRCSSGQCIPTERKCDGVNDCYDGSDESDFTCNSGTGTCNWHLNSCGDERCYAKKLYCDGVRDCQTKDELKGCLNRRLYPSCYAFNQKHGNGMAKIDFGMEHYGAVTVGCTKYDNDRIYVMYPNVQHGDSGIPISTSPTIIRYDVPDLYIEKIISVSKMCTQFIRITCDEQDEKNKNVYWSIREQGGPVFYRKSCDNYCQCEAEPYCEKFGKHKRSLLQAGGWGGGFGRQPPSCECTDNPPTPEIDRRHCQYSGWIAIKDKKQLPIRRISLVWGGMKIIIGNIQCIEDSTPIPSYDVTQKLPCKDGLFTYPRYKCLLEMGPYGVNYGCRDLSHLDNCENFVCPDKTVKCPNSFCLHTSLVCDGVKNCPNGEDENGCGNYQCPGHFKCSGSKHNCVPISYLCDGIRQCEHGEDEDLCQTKCPQECQCFAQGIVYCKNVVPTFDITSLGGMVRYLDLSHNIIDNWNRFKFNDFDKIDELNLAWCSITELRRNSISPFTGLNSLRILDLSFNKVTKIYVQSFAGLQMIQSLDLFGNFGIDDIEPLSFQDQIYLEELRIISTLVSKIAVDTFKGMANLRSLDLSNNRISEVEIGGFEGLSRLKSLDLRGNDLVVVKNMFNGINSLDRIISDSYTFCCESPKSSKFVCDSPKGDVYTCTDLIGHQILQTVAWVMCVLLVLNNGCVSIYRLLSESEHSALGVYMGHLHLANFFYGVYMGAIASADTKYRGIYLWREFEWRSSPVCRAAGVVGSTSTIVSVIIICLMTIDLWFQIYPRSEFRFRPHHAMKLAFSGWGVSIIIAAVPVTETYTISSTCFFFPITDLYRAGYTFAAIVFIFITSSLSIVVLVAFILMKKQNERKWKMEHLMDKTLEEINLSSVQSVVFSDIIIWLLIAILGFCSLTNNGVSGDVYQWIIFFVFPLNGVLNPFLYIYSSNYKKMQREQYDKKQAEIVGQFGTAYDHPLFYQTENHISIRRHLGCMYLETGNCFVSMNDAYIMLTKTAECLAYLHSQGMVHGRVNDETVSIVLNDDQQVIDSNLILKKKKKKHQLLKYEDDVCTLGELGRGLCRRIQ